MSAACGSAFRETSITGVRDAARRPKSSRTPVIEVSRNAEPQAADTPLVLPYFEVEEWDV